MEATSSELTSSAANSAVTFPVLCCFDIDDTLLHMHGTTGIAPPIKNKSLLIPYLWFAQHIRNMTFGVITSRTPEMDKDPNTAGKTVAETLKEFEPYGITFHPRLTSLKDTEVLDKEAEGRNKLKEMEQEEHDKQYACKNIQLNILKARFEANASTTITHQKMLFLDDSEGNITCAGFLQVQCVSVPHPGGATGSTSVTYLTEDFARLIEFDEAVFLAQAPENVKALYRASKMFKRLSDQTTKSETPTFVSCIDRYTTTKAKNKMKSYEQLKLVFDLCANYDSPAEGRDRIHRDDAMCTLLAYLIKFLEASKTSIEKKPKIGKLIRFVVAGLLFSFDEYKCSGTSDLRQFTIPQHQSEGAAAGSSSAADTSLHVAVPANMLPDLNKNDLFTVIDSLLEKLKAALNAVNSSSQLHALYHYAAPFMDYAFEAEHATAGKYRKGSEVDFSYTIVRQILDVKDYGSFEQFIQYLYVQIRSPENQELKAHMEQLLDNLIRAAFVGRTLDFWAYDTTRNINADMQGILQLMMANQATYVSRHTLTLNQQFPGHDLVEQRQYYANIWATLRAIFSNAPRESAPDYYCSFARASVNPATVLTDLILHHPELAPEDRAEVHKHARVWNTQLFAYAKSHRVTLDPSQVVHKNIIDYTGARLTKASIDSDYDQFVKSSESAVTAASSTTSESLSTLPSTVGGGPVFGAPKEEGGTLAGHHPSVGTYQYVEFPTDQQAEQNHIK